MEHLDGSTPPAATAGMTDPVCGMTVQPDGARAKGLSSLHEGVEYVFCGRGCKLEFDDHPATYLDPAYIPSM
jgi:Cu+-exporting ATPase